MSFAGNQRFELRRELGRGGMGVVYEAFDTERHQPVALKMLHRNDPETIVQLKQEFRSLSEIVHPHLIGMYEPLGNEQHCFFTMEFVCDGSNFMAHLRRQMGLAQAAVVPQTSLRATGSGASPVFGRHGVELIGYCLMSNHVHLVAVPQSKDALARSLKQIHGRFASYWNAVNRSSGHVWQGRYYSCPLDDTHLWEALRYTQLNPVRACLVTSAMDGPWSSAAAHCGTGPIGPWLSFDAWERRWSCTHWRAYLQTTQPESSRKAIRDSTFQWAPTRLSRIYSRTGKAGTSATDQAEARTQEALRVRPGTGHFLLRPFLILLKVRPRTDR